MTSSDDEFRHLLRQLDEIHSKIDDLIGERSAAPDSISPDAARAALKASRLRMRRRRFFGETLFGDPAWEILTELYLAEADGRDQPAASLALASSVPESTAFRWIDALAEQGWVVLFRDRTGPERLLVRLSDEGRRSMTLVFSEPKILMLGR